VKRITLILAVAALAVAPAAAGLNPAEAKALLRVAVKLSGLSAREQVPIVVESPARFRRHQVALLDRSYPRAAQNYDEAVYRALGLVTGRKGVLHKTLIELQDGTGLYDPATRTAYVRAGVGARTAALREVVHGLQDQHFDLGRIRRLRGGSDARIAATAAVEGYATLVTNVLPRREPVSHSGPKLTRFLELERGFVDSIGLRFEADVLNLGGTKAAIDSLRRFPATSEQVFHLDKYLEREPASAIALPVQAAGMTLARHGTFGELDVRALLAVFDVPRLDQVGSGWGGGRTARYAGAAGGAVVVALDWDTALDATQWAAAVTLFVNEAFDAARAGPPATSACAAASCWRIGPRAIAFDRSGRRTALAIGADLTTAEALARAITGRA
jgi:hypothetical protein